IEFALCYPRQCLLPRLESRSLVRQLWPGEGINQQYVELASLELNSLQKLYLHEIEEVNRWWTGWGLDKYEFARQPIVKSHFPIVTCFFEPKFSDSRVDLTKCGCLVSLQDDFFDNPTTELKDLEKYYEAVKRWDVSLVEGLPHHMALTFRCLHTTVNDMFIEVIRSVLKEAEWKHSRYIPTFDEYIKVGVNTVCAAACTMSSTFLLGEQVSEEDLKRIGPGSRLLHLVSIIARLSNDIVTFERELGEGQMASGVGCYMKEHPGCSKEQAIVHLRHLIASSNRELEWELFKCRGIVPDLCSQGVVDFARQMSLLYKRADGYANGLDMDFEWLIKDFYHNLLP
ncbi:bifunctional isopimaradiene synthase, chloroplastic, partial [Amborella trichopoda]